MGSMFKQIRSMFSMNKEKAFQASLTDYHRENYLQTIGEFDKVFNFIDSPDTKNVTSTILFNGVDFNSIDVGNLEKQFEKSFGKLKFILSPNSGIPGHKVYYFRLSTSHLSFSIQFHFVYGQFFFLSNRVYSFVLLSNNDKQMIIENIASKYLSDMDLSSNEFSLKDSEGNVVYTVDSVSFLVNYIANTPIARKLKDQCSGYVNSNRHNEIKDTVNKIF